MRVIKRCFVLVPVVAIALMAGTAPAKAGGLTSLIWGFTEKGWETGPSVVGAEAEVSTEIDTNCLTFSVTGDERDFTVKVEGKKSFASSGVAEDELGTARGGLEDLQDLLECLSLLAPADIRMANDYTNWFELASGAWSDLEGPDGRPLEYACMQVEASDGGNRRAPSVVEFDGATSQVALQGAGVSAANGPTYGSGTFENLSELGFAFLIDGNGDPGAVDLTWEFDISIDECGGGWDGPDIDIEHYRRRAEQATALPDTL